jgi:tRNA(Ile)-lysidine synthase
VKNLDMQSIRDTFLNFMRSIPDSTEKTYLVGVSGGIDSVALLHLLAENGYQISVAHCNFQLRGKESDRDEEFTQQLAVDMGLTCYTRKFETASYAREKGISIQMAARELRLGFMNEISTNNNIQNICLAHHADDNIETFFLNIVRGTGLKGLKGMSPVHGNCIRPLLSVFRHEIEAYINEKGLKFCEDSSNAGDTYKRNHIRHHIIPALENRFPDFRSTMDQNLMKILQGITLYKELITKVSSSNTVKKNGIIHIGLSFLSQYNNQQLLLGEILQKYGFTHQQSVDILKSGFQPETTSYYSEQFVLHAKSGKLEIVENREEEFLTIKIHSTDDFMKSIVPANIKVNEIDSFEIHSLKKGPEHAFFDESKIKFPLFLRTWQKGDKFIPFGMQGKKLVSDFFTDIKLTEQQKKNTFLLTDSKNIIWIVGYRIDNRYKVSSKTKKIIHMQLFS